MAGSVSFSIIVVCSLILIFVWDQNPTEEISFSNKITVLAFVFVIELTVSNSFNFYAVYLNELYLTQVRLIAVGFIKTFGSVTTIVSSQIINACLVSGFKIMILFAILAAISVALYLVLP